MQEGIILVDKPKGITSFDVIRILRKKYNVWKMGHAGTLDPFATGLLIVALGKSTKLLSNYLKLPKTYEAKVVLGKTTDTLDTDGVIVEDKDASHIKDEETFKAVESLVGTLEIHVPVYSAIKRDGEALYKKARRGDKVETPVKQMTVTKAEIKEIKREGTEIKIDIIFDVESGTYIRSLAEELGKRLGVPGMLEELRRTKIGDFKIENAEIIETSLLRPKPQAQRPGL